MSADKQDHPAAADVYRRLAQRLDETPNGFPATASGAELRLLAKVFTPLEASVAAELTQTPCSAAEVAERLGKDPSGLRAILKAMARKGLIGVRRGEGTLGYHIIPWAIGIYENQLPRIDAELAELTEAYFREAGGVGYGDPPIHRVLPVGEAIDFTLGIHAPGEARALVESAASWGVRDCICRVQQKLVGKGCERPVENCLVFAPVPDAFSHSAVDRAIDKQEALRILDQAEDAGLVHTTGNWRDGHNYICNCCTCCCGVLRGLTEFHSPTAVANSGYRATIAEEDCVGCGTCLDRCQFGALSMPSDIAQVDAGRCVGCGLCARTCPTGAITLVPLAKGERPMVPEDAAAWGEARYGRRSAPAR